MGFAGTKPCGTGPFTSCAMMFVLVASALCSSAAVGAADGAFVHPGVFVDAPRLARIRAAVLGANASGPLHDAYLAAKRSRYAPNGTYMPRGPPPSGTIECGSFSHPDHGCSDEATDTTTAYLSALLWAIGGEPHHAAAAVAVLDAYARGLKRYNNTNAPLQAAWAAMMLSKAAELLAHGHPPPGHPPPHQGHHSSPGSGSAAQAQTTQAAQVQAAAQARAAAVSPWPAADQAALAAMHRAVTVPLIRNGSGANGNWELSMLDALAGIAVFAEDRALLDHALALWRQRLPAYLYLHALDGGAPVPPPRGHPSWYGQATFNASVDGVCQETCRDLGHMQFGLASALYAAETASIQGVDLLGEMQPRIVAALEFHATLLLNETAVPADVCAGAGVKIARAPTFEAGFDQYHRRRNISLPATARYIAARVRGRDPCVGLIYAAESLTHGGEL